MGLSQRKMAVKLGVDPATLMGWEAERHQPTGKSLVLIEKVLSASAAKSLWPLAARTSVSQPS